MDTIKIYLADSGDFASLVKNFPLYIGSYQNKLVNVYVPTRILAPDFISQLDGVTISEYVAGTAVKIGLSYTASNGLIKISKGRYLNYIKTLTYQNVEYALFERRLPKEFTMYAGQGENAPQLTINVVNIETDVEQGEEPVVLDTITSQICYLDVMPSTVLDNEEEIEPSELETINARLTAIDTTLAEKQNITDEALNTTSKTVVGGINELKATSDIHTQQIGENTEDIAENRNDIDYLYGHMAQAEEYVGQMTGTVLPSDNALTAFVVATTSPSRQPKNADVVIFILQIPGETDKNYKYLFADAGWGGYEIPPMELSSNGTAGLVKGTYSIGSENDTLVDISGGQILNIYVKDTAGTYRNIREYANTLNTTIESIISGNTSVGSAVKALQDGLGNNIVNTYLTQNAGATKQYVRDYSLPREFNDTYFIASTGYQGTIPTTPESGIQFSEISSAVGDLTLFQIEKTNIADFQLASKNSSHNTIYISTNRNCTVYFRLTTQAKKFGQEWVDLSIELSNWIALTNGDIQKLTFGSTFSALDDTILIMADNDLFRQKLEVITQESAETTFNIYSNETYPSSFGINTQAQVQVIAQGDLGEQPVYELSGEINENIVSFEFNSLTILNENVEAKFVLEYTTETELADDVELVLTLNEENIRLVTPYNINNGNATVKYLKQTATQHFSGVQSWAFKGFIQKNGSDFEIFVDIDNIEDYIEGIDYLKDPAKTYLVIKTPADNDTFTLLTGSSGSPNYTVAWGDGESETITTTDNPSHEYTTAGMYLITISGSFENGIVFGSDANVNKNKIIEVYGGSNYPLPIGQDAFYGCTYLTTANFPNATSIGIYAFQNCTSLTTANFPNATSIGIYAFRDCTSLTTVNFPQATSIESSAFRDCTSLKELTLGNVTSTSTGTRFENVKLTNLTIAQDVTDTDIERIKQFYADNGGTFIGNETKNGLQVEKTPTADLDVVRKVDLDTHTSNTSNPHTVTKSQVGLSNAYNPTAYGGVSYGGGNSETGVSFTDLNSLAYTGFYTCFGTTANVPSASYSWFIQHENSNVGNVSATQTATAYATTNIIYKRNKISSTWSAWENISPSLKVDKVAGKGLSTNDYTTDEKDKLAGIASGAEVNVQSDWNQADSSADDYIKNKPTISDGLTLYTATGQSTDGAMTQKATTDELAVKVDKAYSDEWAYTSGLVITWNTDHYRVGDGTTTDGNAFPSGSPTEIIIPKYYDDGTNGVALVTEIGQYAFRQKTTITSVKIPDSITSIKEYSFYYCTALEKIIIPNNVTSIGNWAFFNCSNIKSITIPDSVTSIGDFVFLFNTNLTNMTFKGLNPPTLGESAITENTSAIYVPYESLTAYKTADSWLTYANVIYPMPDGKDLNDKLALKANSDGSNLTAGNVDSFALKLIDKIYPVGSVYLSVSNTSPASFIGGTWTAIAEGQTLWTTTTASTGGDPISAGLPNITGALKCYKYDTTFTNGAFYSQDIEKNTGCNVNNDATQYVQYKFDASKSNAIYGASNTVQPPAIKVYMWKRTA